MQKKYFRKEALDQITSPDSLDHYIRVTTPSVWLLIGAIFIFLAGVFIWGIFGHLDTTVTGAAVVKNGSMECYVKAEDVTKLKKGLKVSVNGKTYTMKTPADKPVVVSKKHHSYLMHLGNFKNGEWVYQVDIGQTEVPDGIYDAEITVESIAPVRFLLN